MKSLLRRESLGIGLVLLGEALLVLHKASGSNYYFPFVWFGYIFTLDGLLDRLGYPSLWRSSKAVFLLMIPVSAGFWWLFEAFDQAVGSWRYTGSGGFTGAGYVIYASVCFSTVLLAVWETALCVGLALPYSLRPQGDLLRSLRIRDSDPSVDKSHQFRIVSTPSTAGTRHTTHNAQRTTQLVMSGSVLFGVASIIVPALYPHYAFGLIWVSLFFLIDPINYWLGRSSLLYEVTQGRLGIALAFGIAGPICGFFWEAWNYWATVKWVYNVPFVSQLHLFEMPLPGYLGYIPFGLEVYAATVFVLPTLALLARRKLILEAPAGRMIGDARGQSRGTGCDVAAH
jgi:hypothetical protein